MSLDLQTVIPHGRPNHGTPTVSTEDLRRILAPAIEEMERNAAPRAIDPDSPGVRDEIGRTASHIRGLKEDAGRRRLYDIDRNESDTMTIDWADAFFIAMGKSLANEPLPVMPGSRISALEMVAAFSDYGAVEEALTLPEQRKLAGSLFHFARGYLYAERVLDACEATEREVVAA